VELFEKYEKLKTDVHSLKRKCVFDDPVTFMDHSEYFPDIDIDQEEITSFQKAEEPVKPFKLSRPDFGDWTCTRRKKRKKSAIFVTNDKNDTENRQHYLRLVMNEDGKTVDHKDRNTRYNQRKKLRFASKQTQTLNQGIRSDNTSGVKGVSYDEDNKRWIVTWSDEKGTLCRKYFHIKKHGGDDAAKGKAIAFRENIERTNPLYKEALDPQRDEL
jgi:hypothetical protein